MLEVREMVPQKWFEFGHLENYQSSNDLFQVSLTVVRDQITSLEPNEIQDKRIINEKAPNFSTTFWKLRHICGLNIIVTRLNNFAEKRHEKKSYGLPTSGAVSVWVGPSYA